MRKSLYEMDHQYELEQAEKQVIITTVKVLKEVDTAPAIIVQKLVDNYQLTPQQAKEYLNSN